MYSKFENSPDYMLLQNEPMKNHTSFRVGGNADLLAIPKTKAGLLQLLKICRSNYIKHYIIGNGSNILVTAEGFRGVIIKITKYLSDTHINGNIITADSGILLSTLSNIICEHGLTDFEFAAGIPGSLGGAVCMNAGAYGGEIKDVLVSAECIYANGETAILQNNQLELGYRTSLIIQKDLVVLSATLKLSKGNKNEIKEKILELNSKRKKSQPLELPSAGSTFKRPEGYFAGKLIMDCGLAGYSIGDAMVSEKHCGFIVNKGNAKASDIIQLIEHIKHEVYQKFKVMLEPEIKIIG